MAHPGGRPREYDRVAIGRALLDFCKNNLDTFILPQAGVALDMDCGLWCDWDYDEPDGEFSYFYHKAKQQIAINRLKATLSDGPLDKSLYHRGAGLYDNSLHKYERSEKRFESDLKRQESLQVAPDIANAFAALMAQVSTAQADNKIDRKINKADSKS